MRESSAQTQDTHVGVPREFPNPPSPLFQRGNLTIPRSHSPRFTVHSLLAALLLFLAPAPVFAQAVEEPVPADAPSAEFILLEADKVRNPQIDYIVYVTVTSYHPDREPREGEYEVYVKGRENTLVKTLKPRRESNRLLLMRGRDLWAYLPNVSKPLRISMRDRLMGDVANGDIARTNFSGDYKPTLVRIDRWDEDTAHYVLDLEAVSRNVTYAAVRLWVEVGTYNPARAEFFALSGRLLKSCRYTDFQEMGGQLRPTRMILQDPTLNGQYSEMVYTSMEVKSLPDRYFTQQYMKRMSN